MFELTAKGKVVSLSKIEDKVYSEETKKYEPTGKYNFHLQFTTISEDGVVKVDKIKIKDLELKDYDTFKSKVLDKDIECEVSTFSMDNNQNVYLSTIMEKISIKK